MTYLSKRIIKQLTLIIITLITLIIIILIILRQCRLPGHRSRSSSLSLTVESALESFDFLNTSDFDDEDTGDDNGVLSLPPQRSPIFDADGERIG